MAFNTNDPRQEFTASAAQTVFPFNFKIYFDTDIKVYQTPIGKLPNDDTDLLELTTDYTVTINGDAGGEVILNTGTGDGDALTLVRALSVTRYIEYQTSGDLLAETLNDDQEYQTYLTADSGASESLYMKLAENTQGVSVAMPAAEASAYLRWNAAANALENDNTSPGFVQETQELVWDAEAERLTADSYATEAEDTFVNAYTSDGDGTFTATPTIEYSALHWAAKSEGWSPAGYLPLSGGTVTGQIKGITPVDDADLARKDYVDTAVGTLSSGSSVATISFVANGTAVVLGEQKWTRVGSIVTVTGAITIDPTNTTTCSVYLTLPIPSSLTDNYDISGMLCTHEVGEDNNGYVRAYTTDNEARILVYPVDIASKDWTYSYTYEVK